MKIRDQDDGAGGIPLTVHSTFLFGALCCYAHATRGARSLSRLRNPPIPPAPAIGRQLEADQVRVAWVKRVSGLILTLTYEIHDVATGQATASKTFGFRGDNDVAWARAIDYLVRDQQQSGR